MWSICGSSANKLATNTATAAVKMVVHTGTIMHSNATSYYHQPCQTADSSHPNLVKAFIHRFGKLTLQAVNADLSCSFR